MNAQELIVGHLLPIAAALAVLWVVYRLLFSNSNRLKFNRAFLLSSLLFALALPLIGLLVGQEAPQMASWKQNLLSGTMLSEVTVMPEGQMEKAITEVDEIMVVQPRVTFWQILGILYLIGAGVMMLMFLFKLGKLLVLILRSPKRRKDGYTAVYLTKVPEPVEGPTYKGSESPQGSFSFFRYAFFPNENVAPDIVNHELSHIRHHHSWDILFAELMMIVQWFNPFVYLYKKELQSLHEYQADRDVVATGVNKREYMMLILQQCTAGDFSGMSNNFSLILTKKRIKMITRNEKAKGLWWRLLATLPLLAILLVANTKVAAQEQQPEKKQINVEIGQFEIYDDDGNLMNLTDTVIYNEDGSYVQFKTTEAPDPITGEMRNKITATSCNADGTPNEKIKFTINAIEKHGDTTLYTVEPFTIDADKFKLSIQTTEDNPVRVLEKDNDTIFQIVEEMPQFPGGEKAMMEFVAKNIEYPQEAKDNNIQGRVFISFVVEKDGSIGEVKVMRGIGGGCDEAAVRVVKAMPKWKPGMQKGKPVRVSYMMPIFFKLTDETNSAKGNGLVGTIWEGTGTGTKDGVTYTWHSVMQFSSEGEGLMIEKLVSQKKNSEPVIEFENVAMDFEYAFDGKKTGAITPKNGDGTYMDENPPEGFILSDDGKTIILNFYTATEDTGIKFVTYSRR